MWTADHLAHEIPHPQGWGPTFLSRTTLSVSAARVTLEHRGLALSNFSHDFDSAVAIRAQRHLRSGDERDDAQGPFTAASLRRRWHRALTIRQLYVIGKTALRRSFVPITWRATDKRRSRAETAGRPRAATKAARSPGRPRCASTQPGDRSPGCGSRPRSAPGAGSGSPLEAGRNGARTQSSPAPSERIKPPRGEARPARRAPAEPALPAGGRPSERRSRSGRATHRQSPAWWPRRSPR